MQRAIFLMVLGIAVLLGGGLWYLSSAPKQASADADPAAGAHFVYGSPDAPVTVVEFSNYLCPHCKDHSEKSLPRIFADYVETGKVRYIFRDFPFAGQDNVILAGEAAACAADQGRYYDYHQLLFRATGQWGRVPTSDLPAYFSDYARQLGLDTARFDACLSSHEKRPLVLADQELTRKLGLGGTPSFFVNGKFIEGFRPYEEWKKILDEALAGN
ncbi:DsbA family protein [Oceanithermus sp.]|uniref:DsbA family protein n=1 Tax=Oceanithermus sp. TaxID=2268145 RepID=UPI00257BA62A|nr:DsbA family protein [Oceanithermus sp.]